MVNTVRSLAQKNFKPRVKKWQDGSFPFENVKNLADIGVLGMAVPEEYGGLGLPVLDCVVVLEEIAKVCYVCRPVLSWSATRSKRRVIRSRLPNPLAMSGVVTMAQAEPSLTPQQS
jgi:alkylation response protein AidB-like acyl-CoA dehydrogenase